MPSEEPALMLRAVINLLKLLKSNQATLVDFHVLQVVETLVDWLEMDITELTAKSLEALKILSLDHPRAILQARGVPACLVNFSYFDLD